MFCQNCNMEISAARVKSHPNIKYCSKRCSNEDAKNRYRSHNKLKGICAGTVGAIGEFKVAIDLLSKKKEVFRALSPSCSCDLAVIEDNQLKKVEVRTGYISPSGKIQYPKKNIRADILAVVVGNEIHYINNFI